MNPSLLDHWQTLYSLGQQIQTELPHHLRLPVDSTEELGKYYNALGCVMLLQEDKKLLFLSISLLDRYDTFKIYQVINLPIPYPQVEQEFRALAKYKIETEFIALNLARTKFMLMYVEALKCRNDALGTYTSVSPIYMTGSHKVCMLELFNRDKGGIKRNCQAEVLANIALPKAISLSNRVWALATQKEIKLSKV